MTNAVPPMVSPDLKLMSLESTSQSRCWQEREAIGMRRRLASVSLLLVASVFASCNRTTKGPLAYHGLPNNWIGPVAVGQPRAWGLIRFGKEGLQARVTSVTFGTPHRTGS